MAEWLYENGIGEDRAALIEGDMILEAIIEPHGDWVRAGAIVEARLTELVAEKRAGRLALDNGEEALLQPLPGALTEGETIFVEITREAIAEPGRAKLAIARHMPKAQGFRPAPALEERLAHGVHPVLEAPAHGSDAFEDAGWSDLLEQAITGAMPFAGGALRVSLTPAMTVIDVDGALRPGELAVAGARAAGEAIRKFDIAGNIGIDLPTLEMKSDRQLAVAAFDDALPQPFERTAINGFGFLQVIRRKRRASLLELAQYDPSAFAARALLRRAERSSGAGERTITAHPAVLRQLEVHDAWLKALERSLGVSVVLKPDPSLGLSGGHVSAVQP